MPARNQTGALCRLTLLLLVGGALAAGGGCGGGGSSDPAPPPGYSLGGPVIGLTTSGLVLVSGSDTTSVAANATGFTFPTLLATGTAYKVTVQTQPANSFCYVVAGRGTMGNVAVKDVRVYCAPTYSVGGTITGLGANTGLVLLNNGVQGGDPTQINANATTFTMNTRVTAGTGYNIAVGTSPHVPGLNCTVSNGTGYVSSNVTSVVIDCSTVNVTAIAYVGSAIGTPLGVAVDAAGNLYVTDIANNAVKEIVAATGTVRTLASGFHQPWGVAVDAAGNVYVADYFNDAVKEIVAATGAVKAVGPPLYRPNGVAVDAAGDVYVADSFNNAVEEIVATTGAVKVLMVAPPNGVAVDAAGNVYVAQDGAIDEIVAATGAIKTLSSNFTIFNIPAGIAVDTAGNVYVANGGNDAVEEIVAATGAVIQLVSGFNNPVGIAVDANGRVYVVDGSGLWAFTP